MESHIPISMPVMNHADYYNRKGFYSVIVQAVVDYRCRFMNVYTGWPGSVRDVWCFQIQQKLLKELKYHFI